MAMRKQLKDICRGFTKNIALKDLGQHEGQFPIYGASGYIKDVDFYCCDTPYIGIVKDGSGVGRVDVYPGYSSLLGTMQYIVPKDEVDLQYLKYALIAMDLGSLYKGAAIPHIYFKEYGKFFVDLPDLETQKHISASLDTIQKAIDLKRKQLQDLDELVKSKFQEMFGDPVENEKGWDVKKLEEIVAEGCSISYGIVQPGDGVDDGVPVVRPVDMVNTFVFRDGLKQTTKEISNSYKRTILKGDEILLCVRGTTGMVALASERLKDCNVTRGITPIECSESINRWFVYYQFLTEGTQHYIAERTQGIALKQINMKDVREIPFIVPPIEQQKVFAEFARKADAANAIIKQEISDLEELMDSKMDEYFG